MEVRADAAFLTGSVGALQELKRCVGVATVNQLRQAWPAHFSSMDVATANLEARGADGTVRHWQSDQPTGLAKPQKSWTTSINEKLSKDLPILADNRHAAAIQSAVTSEGSRFLQLPSQSCEKMSDDAFRTAARRRLGLTPTASNVPISSTCQNVKKKDGTRCAAVLDSAGHHGCVCEAGGALDRRNNAVRDRLAKRLADDLQLSTRTEQRCPQWDKIDAHGKLAEARLDIIVPMGNVTYYIDVTVVDVLSTDPALERQRANRDGAAAASAEDKKLVKYPGAATIPFAIESYGRIGTAGLAWLKRAYHESPACMQALLNELSALVQSHTASMVLAACAAPARGRA